MRRISGALVGLALLLALLPGVAAAHGFGNRYELSLPVWLFVTGGAGVVLVSFGVVSVFAGREHEAFEYRSRSLRGTASSVVGSPVVVGAARALVVAFLALAVVAGFVGPTDFNRNLLTNVVWVGWWVGYTFSVIFVANTWPVVNPWKTVYDGVARLLGRPPTLGREYRFEALPVAVAFLAFAWLEIVSNLSRSPRGMALVVLAYSAYVWGGMAVYGRDEWLRHADIFTRLYRYLGKFAPLSVADGELRGYGVGLVENDETLFETGALFFLVAVLYSVTFDGFLGTPEWRAIALAAPELPVPGLTTTLLMLAGVALFYAVYRGFGWLMTAVTGTDLGGDYLARRFALSLLPIAIVYQVAHFYTFLLIQGQFLVLALNDPLGLGWNLLGLGGFQPSATLPVVSVQFVWQSQVALIVLGHVVAVWVAHHIALDVFATRREAIRSQVPMMALMVLYTMLSLWILTRPVVTPPLP